MMQDPVAHTCHMLAIEKMQVLPINDPTKARMMMYDTVARIVGQTSEAMLLLWDMIILT